MLAVGWFSTGRGEGSLGLLKFIQERISEGELDVRIQFVFSNREPGEGEGSDRFFQQVKDYGLPLINFSSRIFRRTMGGDFTDHRLEYDRGVMARLKEFSPDVCVLAGYMLIVGSEMRRDYTMLNLHPALPTGPTGTWQDVIWHLIESREDRTGAMVHLVTEDLDRGPVVTYFSMPIVGAAFDNCWREAEGKSLSALKTAYGEELRLFRIIRQEEYRREPYLLAATLKVLAKGAIKVAGGRVRDASSKPVQGLCLNSEIEEALASS